MSKCTEEGCDVRTTGICINQFADLKTCPHYSEEENNSNGSKPEDPVRITNGDIEANNGKSDNKVFKTYTGLSLLQEEANIISKDSYTRLVILAGLPKAGKTTTLLSLMHKLETQDDYCDYLFAGSKTLVDLEQKAWLSRIHSKSEKSDTPRTNEMELKFVHLKVANKDSLDKKTNLLFTDVSGELFRSIRDSKAECEKFTIALRADHFVLFFDSDTLSEPSKKNNAKISGLELLKGLINAQVLTPRTQLQIVFSRWDLLDKKLNKETHIQFINEIKSEITKKYSSNFVITFVDTASRPEKSKIPFAFGLDILFKLWVTKSQLDFNTLSLPKKEESSSPLREFLKF